MSRFRGRVYLDLREWFEPGSDGQMLPTKKGINVPADCLGDLQDAVDAFRAELERARRAEAGMRLLGAHVLVDPGGLAVGASVGPVEAAFTIGPLGLDEFVARVVGLGAGISERMTCDRGLGATDACGGHGDAGKSRWRAALRHRGQGGFQPECRPQPERGWSSAGLYLRGVSAGSKDPSYRALGYGASLVGARAHGIILDDPHNQQQSESLAEQESAFRYHEMSVSPRLVPGGWELCISTRWHATDLPARLVATGAWEVLRTSTEGATVAPWPERHPVEDLQERQRTMGGPWYACVHDSDPTSLGGDIFRAEYFQPLPAGLNAADLTRILAIDTAWSEAASADFTAGLVYGFRPGQPDRYILGLERRRVDDRDPGQHLAEVILRWRPSLVGIEEAAYKQGRTQQLIHEIWQLLEGQYAVAVRAVRVDKD